MGERWDGAENMSAPFFSPLRLQGGFPALLELLGEAQQRGDEASCRLLLPFLFSCASTSSERHAVRRHAVSLLCQAGAPEQALPILCAQPLRTVGDLMAWAQVLLRLDQLPLAEMLVEAALRSQQQMRLPTLARLLNLRGYLARRIGDWGMASACYQRAFHCCNRGTSPGLFATLLNNLSNVLSLQGQTSAALRYCVLGLQGVGGGMMAPSQIGLSMSTMGLLWLRAGNVDQAEPWIREAGRLFAPPNNRHRLLAHVSDRLGQIALGRGDLENAQRWFVAASRQAMDAEARISSVLHQGQLALCQGTLLVALSCFREAMVQAANGSDLAQLAESAHALGHVAASPCLVQEEALQMVAEARRPLLQAHLRRLQTEESGGHQRRLPGPRKREPE